MNDSRAEFVASIGKILHRLRCLDDQFDEYRRQLGEVPKCALSGLCDLRIWGENVIELIVTHILKKQISFRNIRLTSDVVDSFFLQLHDSSAIRLWIEIYPNVGKVIISQIESIFASWIELKQRISNYDPTIQVSLVKPLLRDLCSIKREDTVYGHGYLCSHCRRLYLKDCRCNYCQKARQIVMVCC